MDTFTDLIYVIIGIILGFLVYSLVIKRDILVIDTNVKKQSNCINKNL